MNFKTVLLPFAVALAMASGPGAWAQVPAGSTGQCKDNSYTSADVKRGACKGHGGIKDWYGAKKADAEMNKGNSGAMAKGGMDKTRVDKGAMTEKEPSKPVAKSTTERTEPAAGGGAGKVWVNTASNVYHCEGTRWYGKTKKGEYMSEAEAKAKNAHPDHGKACG